MNKSIKTAISIIMILIFTVVTVFTIISFLNKSNPDIDVINHEIVPELSETLKTSNNSELSDNSELSESEEKYYVVRDYDGNLGIFSPADSDTPQLKTEIRTDSLREADKKLVILGITVRGFNNLAKLLEDFGS